MKYICLAININAASSIQFYFAFIKWNPFKN